jgi:dihydrofolate reductase
MSCDVARRLRPTPKPPPKVGDEELAERVNGIPKYVVSNTLRRADWSNSTLISGDVVGQVNDLKEQPGGDLVVYGSADLVDLLLEHGLVDEYGFSSTPRSWGAESTCSATGSTPTICSSSAPRPSALESFSSPTSLSLRSGKT